MKRNQGVALLMVLILILLMSASAYVAVIVGMNRSKAARFYENETYCFYAAESGIARGRHNLESFEAEYNGAWTIVKVEQTGSIITIASTAVLYQSDRTITVTLVNEPIIIPQVASLYLTDYSTINLNGSAFEIDGNDKDGIVTNGSPIELLVMIDEVYYDQIEGVSGTPSIGQNNTIDFNNVFQLLSSIAEPTFGTELSPAITLLSGETRLTGNQEAHGVLLVNGDLTISGTFDFSGLIMINGDLTVTGDMLISGSVMVSGDLEKVAGSIAIEYDEDQLNAVQSYVDSGETIYKQVAWIQK